MTQPIPSDVTGLLVAWSNGDSGALGQLIPLVHAEPRRALEELLATAEKVGSFIETPALDLAARVMAGNMVPGYDFPDFRILSRAPFSAFRSRELTGHSGGASR